MKQLKQAYSSIRRRYTPTGVFLSAAGTVVLMALASAALPGPLQTLTNHLSSSIISHFGWYYLLLVSAIVVLCLFFILTPMGRIRLGNPGSKPEYSRLSWLAMLFSAGMGIGLVFFGAAEPLSHFAVATPQAEPGSQEALADALRYTFFHWGIHAWAIYAIVALALAYFKFRKKEPSLLSMTLKPLFGRTMERFPGKLVDYVCIITTALGVATTLGFGAAQIGSGLEYLVQVPNTLQLQLGIIAAATILFLLSAVSGVDKGVRMLSNINIALAVFLVAAALFLGPTVQILNTLVDTLGSYLQNFVRMSFRTGAFNAVRQEWIEQWTIFYWAWWLSWSPFVGMFIARISKGRTIREFLTCVLLIPTLFSFLWFSVFGILASETYSVYPQIAQMPSEQVLFGILQAYPASTALSVITVLLLFIFFITSADSATFVLSMLSEKGSLVPHDSVKIVWGLLVSLIAGLLLTIGGLAALQNAMIIAAFPFSFIVILMMIALYIELSHEQREMGLYIKPETYPPKNAPFRSYEENS